jgi:hypothetical protein
VGYLSVALERKNNAKAGLRKSFSVKVIKASI